MSRGDPDRLYRLLPAVYRLRDAERGEPLRALLRVIGEQVTVVESDIEQLYDNWFIETCEDWVVPYIADLIGYQPVPEAGPPGESTTPEGEQRNRILIPRREVANTIRYRRRKGTLALLELLARDVAGWPARAVEFYTLLSTTQSINHPRLDRGRLVDLKRTDALDRIDGAFDELARSASIGRPGPTPARSGYTLTGVGLFVWRLKPYSVTQAPAYCIDRARHHYTFSVLGNNAPLITWPIEERGSTEIAGELNVPTLIRHSAFRTHTSDYYGEGKSLRIWRDGLDRPVPLEHIVPADLSDWTSVPQREQVAVDPVLGRIAFSPHDPPESGVWVSYHYGLSDDLGGGEYRRVLRPSGRRPVYRVHGEERLMDAVARWRSEKREDASRQDAIIEIGDSGTYQELIEIVLEEGDRLEIRAAQGTRPTLRLLDWHSNRPDQLRIRGVSPEAVELQKEASGVRLPRLVLDGLLITGRSVQVVGAVDQVIIRHCTLVPGWSLEQDSQPTNEEEPSLELDDSSASVLIDHSIVGSIRVNESEVATDPVRITLLDSIVDATRSTLAALDAPEGRHAHAVLTVRRVTLLGHVLVHAIELAENSIFAGPVRVARRQWGCMRFCYVPRDSRTPWRYNCQPDLSLAAIRASGLTPPDQEDAETREASRVRPLFNSARYGAPDYCQLAEGCAPEITRGADDEGEMGALHNLFQPQREASLDTRLDEYTPAGTDARIIFVT